MSNLIPSLLIVCNDDTKSVDKVVNTTINTTTTITNDDDKNRTTISTSINKKKLITMIGDCQQQDITTDTNNKTNQEKDIINDSNQDNNQFLTLSSVSYNNNSSKQLDNQDNINQDDDSNLDKNIVILNNNDESKLCKVCKLQFSIYICPRCNISYCSSSCFKSHSENCTRGFYEQQVRENLQAIDKVEPKDAIGFLKRIKEIYDIEDSKFEELVSKSLNINDDDNSDDDDDDEDNEEIDISKINSMTQEELLSLLSTKDIQEFYNSIKDGSISRLLDNWVPWWIPNNNNIIEEQTVKIKEIIEEEEEEQVEKDIYIDIPTVYNEIPSLSTIFPKTPSDSLYFHLLDILYCYCFIMRSYYGEWALDHFNHSVTVNESSLENEELTFEGCEMILELTTVLQSPTKSVIEQISKLTSTPIVLNTILEKTHSSHNRNLMMNQGNTHFSFAIIQDLLSIISDKQYILATLSHMYRAFKYTSTLSSPSNTTTKTNTLKSFDFVCKKLLFFLAWAQERNSFDALVKSVQVYYKSNKDNYKFSIKNDSTSL